ncbi:diguanylate cyclase domain-containing protein [Alteromonas sp. H39]|uniref:sensor domain-containing diguanylate cyclase n=1 Tax=Alteromonas sp. H39 TaxID=3389876 RepID=UPI0039DFAAE0
MQAVSIEKLGSNWQIRCNKLKQVVDMQTSIAKVGMDLSSVMQIIVTHCGELVRCDGAAIEFKEGERMVYRAASGIAESFLGLSLPVSNSLTGYCLQTGKVQLCNDVFINRRVNQAACAKIGIASMLLIPLHHEDHIIGVLKVLSREKHQFTSEDSAALRLISEQMAATLYYCHRFVKDTLVYQATHDFLTGLYNRSAFMEYFRLEQSLCDPCLDQKFSILVMDMNGLKSVNDKYGHRAGDAMLSELSKRLRNVFRPSDKIARLGGDEFGIIMGNIKSAECIESVLERFQWLSQRPYNFDNIPLTISASVGWAIYPDDSTGNDSLLDIADKRMYQHKHVHYASMEA